MQTQTPPAHKVRSACDSCHKAKMKCSKGTPCAACARSGSRCCYSVSDRLGRPPKSVAKRQKSGVHTNTTSKGREMTTPQLFKGYDCHSEELLTLDDMSVDAFSESLSALSSSEALSCHAFANAEHTGNNLVSLKDDQRPQLSALNQLYLSHSEHEPYNNSQSRSQLIHKDDVRLHNERPDRHRGDVTRCRCLQQYTQLLRDLKDLHRAQDSWESTTTLDAAKQNLQLWQGQLSCRSCWYDEDDGALLLSVMRIGTMLKRLWRLLAHQQRHEFYEHSTDDSLSMFAEFGAAKWTRAETATEPATGISGLAQNEQLRHDTMDHLMSSLMNTNIGSFEKCEDEQKFLVGMLAMRMLRRIKKTLEGLRSMLRQERQGCKNEEHSRNPLSGLIPSMLDKLDKSVTELDQALKCSIDA